MCGIIAIVSRPTTRATPDSARLLALLDAAIADPSVSGAAAEAATCNALLLGVPGVRALVGDQHLAAALSSRLDQLDARAADHERWIESRTALTVDEIEAANGDLK